ncbi:MAG TPA: hypothetical protein VN240_05545 [Propylenella sp.]|nr:hypothetical protein [Propylenella sp.]
MVNDPQTQSGPEPDASAATRLARFDLSLTDIENILRRGEAAAASATPAHPVIAAGMLRWLETVASLRGVLAARRWTFDDTRNSPRVVSPTGELSVIVASGDALTGRQALGLPQPRTVRPRGDATKRALLVNAQLALNLPGLPDLAAEPPARQTWVLLYHRSKPSLGSDDGPVVQSELSLPLSMSSTGYVDSWAETSRIILPDVPVSNRVIVADAGDDGGNDANGEIDFDVPPR